MMPSIQALRRRAVRELIVNRSITIYGFADGVEVDRRRPSTAGACDGLAEAFTKMRDTIQNELFGSIASLAPKLKGITDAFDVRR